MAKNPTSLSLSHADEEQRLAQDEVSTKFVHSSSSSFFAAKSPKKSSPRREFALKLGKNNDLTFHSLEANLEKICKYGENKLGGSRPTLQVVYEGPGNPEGDKAFQQLLLHLPKAGIQLISANEELNSEENVNGKPYAPRLGG